MAQTTLQAIQKPSTTPVKTGFFDAQSFELMQRVSKMFSSSTLVPKQYQGNVANCMIAINMAERIGADPMMVMQNLYVVHGNPSWSAQFLIATFNHCGRFTALKYEWFGEEGTDTWGCRAWATEKITGDRIEGPTVTIGLSKKEGWYSKNGSKWQTIPQLMLMYRAASWMIRANAPELAMGLQTTEEITDIIDVSQGKDGVYSMTTEDLANTEPVVENVDEQQKTPDVDQETGEVLNNPPVEDEKPESSEQTQQSVDFKTLLNSIKTSTDIDVLDADASLIDQVVGVSNREELSRAYKARRAELEGK